MHGLQAAEHAAPTQNMTAKISGKPRKVLWDIKTCQSLSHGAPEQRIAHLDLLEQLLCPVVALKVVPDRLQYGIQLLRERRLQIARV